MLVLESPTAGFDWVQFTDAELGMGGKFEATLEANVGTGNLEPSESSTAGLACASDLLESESARNENSEAILTPDLTIDKSEPVEGPQSKIDWTFEVVYDKFGDPPQVRFPVEGEWFHVLRLCHSSYSLLWTCNLLIRLHRRVPWDDSDLYESNESDLQELKNAYSILWATVSSAFTRLYYQGWDRLSAFSSHDPCFLPGYDEHDRCVYQLVMNIGRRLISDGGVHVLLAVYFDRRQPIKLTLLRRMDGRRHEKWVEQVKLVSLSPGFQLLDDRYGTPEQAFTLEPIPPPSEQEKQAWAFPL